MSTRAPVSVVEVTALDLQGPGVVFCPNPKMPLWSNHPRIFIDVATAREVIEHARAQSYLMVDAPVSGGIAAAEGGTLTFMAGGTDAAFDRARPFLEQMGKAVIHAGAAGAGQAAKICNNMLLGATMVATCEAFALARKLGLDLQTFYDISSKASGQSWSMHDTEK